jgi:16S rRNA (cytosine1402-N4)-methyltransferase
MHQPVLLTEAIEALRIKPAGRYVDGTLGLGGHSAAIAERLGSDGRLLGLDVDAKNLEQAENRLQPYGNLVLTRRANFRGLQAVLREIGWSAVDGVLADLGVSSVHLDQADRGFSFSKAGPLDMRLDPSSGEPVLDILQNADEKQLEERFKEFGERRDARRLSRYILHDVREGKLKTTTDLAGLCERVAGWHGKVHPATRVFLALRDLANDETGALRDLLAAAPDTLATDGRLAIISFHSIEDRMVKHAFRDWAARDGEKRFRVVTKKPVEANDEETAANPRSRSAKMRVLERIE